MTLLDTALTLAAAGCSVVPTRTDGTKAPAGTWKQWTTTRPPAEQLHQWFVGDQFDGLGAICGAVSGNLEMLEAEGRAVDAGKVVELATLMADNGLGDLWARLMSGYLERTPSGGLHWLYRVDGAPRGNTKLARRPATAAELVEQPTDKVKVLFETRGEGGFTVLAPSGGRTHPSGGAWTLLVGGVGTIPLLTVDERDAVHAIATMLDEMPAADASDIAGKTNHGNLTPLGVGQLRPGDDYNARASWDDILDGWTKVRRMGDGWAWRRPGKAEGISATTGQAADGVDRLYVFTSSTDFEPERPYTKFAAHAHLQHGGDYAAAARALRKAGFGAASAEHRHRSPTAPIETRHVESTLWDRRPILDHIHTYARARRTAPLAVLGVVLARVITVTPPFVVLPRSLAPLPHSTHSSHSSDPPARARAQPSPWPPRPSTWESLRHKRQVRAKASPMPI